MNLRSCTLLCTLFLFAFAYASVTQSDADAFATWLDNRVSEFTSKSPRKFRLVPLTGHDERDIGFLGNVKPVATSDIDENEIVYRFTLETTFRFTEGEKEHQEDVIDLLHLVHEKQYIAESDWAPYIKILPTTFTTPVYWTKQEIEELQGTSLYTPMLQLNHSILTDYKYVIANSNYSRLFPNLASADTKEESLISLDEYRWAHSVMRSRNWKTTRGPKICPVLDLFNYGQESNVKVVKREGYWDLVAETSIAEGESLIINDGLIGNRDLLEWYGFVLPTNRNDYFPVGVGLDDEEKLFGMKKDFFKQKGIKDGQTFHLKNNLIPRELIFALRIFHSNMYDYSEMKDALQDKMISAQNEMTVCNTLIDMCENALENLPHSLRSDKALLESDDLSDALRAAATLRRGEKKILVSILKLAKMQADDVKKHWSSRTMEIPTIAKQY